MRRSLTRISVLLAMLSVLSTAVAVQAPPAGALSSTVVISQVYGGGGNSGAPYRNDFVELFNRGTTAVSLSGWSVQYASATGAGLFSANVTPLSGSLAPGKYYLVQMASGGANGSALPAPDATGTTAMGATAGKVVIVNSSTGLACNGGLTPCTPAQLAMIVDLVGWGNADFFEGNVGPWTSNTTADLRNNVGYAETDNNRNDFTAGAPSPRNTASPLRTPPAITTQPSDQAVNDGQTATFTAAASGSPAPTVQWQMSSDGGGTWTDIPGATSPTLTFTAAASQTGYCYRAVFTNAVGTATTNAAMSTVNLPAVVISQVYGGGGNTGATLKNDYIELFNRGTTTVSLAGWSVQYASTTGTTWFKTDLSGSIAPHGCYLIREAQGAGGTVDLPVPDAVGTITMHQSVGKVVLMASQTLIPTGTSCPVGAAIADKVGYGAGTNCFEGGGPTGSLSNTTAALRRGAGCIDTDSNTADFRVGTPTPRTTSSPMNPCAAPTVSAQPADQTVCAGVTATFTAAASGTTEISVRWQMSSDGGGAWTDVPGATSATLTFTAAPSETSNRYRAVFTNDLGTATTNAATLTVRTPPAITTQPSDQTVNDGQAVTFTAAASGSPAPTVQWQVSGDGGGTWTNVPGATNPTLTFTAAAGQTDYRYRAVFTNPCGVAQSNPAILAIRPVTLLPAILPDAVLNEPYRQALAGENGIPPYAFTLAEGVLPPGMKLSNGGVLSGIPTKVGAYVFTVAVTDARGRSASRSYTLLVRYRFMGVQRGVWDTASFTDAYAGATLSMLFSLGGYQGADIFADGMPASRRVSCQTLAPLEPLKPLPKRALGLLYSPTGKAYNYLWMTDYAWAGTCRAFVMTLRDGTTHTVYVRFKVSPFPWGHATGVPVSPDR